MRIVGVSEGWFDLVKRQTLAGRTLTRHDSARSANVCVLTEHGARSILAGGHTIGQPVSIGGMIYEVVGIIRSEHGGEHVPDMRADVYIPIRPCRLPCAGWRRTSFARRAVRGYGSTSISARGNSRPL